ncbi:MAG: hypothetical protein AB7O59_12855 [Pirellulales bacterium]
MLRTTCIPLALGLAFVAAAATAQEPAAARHRDESFAQGGQIAASGVVTPTPEMWLYEQQTRRRDDVQLAIRRRAEVRAQHRQDRIAAAAWFGMSNSRPTAQPIPIYTGYSPWWGSNTFDPLRWRASGGGVMITARPTNAPE